MKYCNKCKTEKEEFLFPKNRSKKGGLHDWCKECHTAAQMRRYNRDPRKAIAASQAWYTKNIDKKREYDKQYFLKDKSKKGKHNKAWNERNKEKVSKTHSAWKKLNSEKVASYASQRRARELNASPSWLTPEQKDEILYMYWLARDLRLTTGENYHVDHIIPLQGKGVCGLHVPWNLQILPADLNLRKHISYE